MIILTFTTIVKSRDNHQKFMII